MTNRPVELQISRLADSDPAVRQSAAVALGKLGDATAVTALEAALQDWDWQVRRHCAEALGRLADTSAVPALIRASRDKEWLVAYNARNTLARLGDSYALPRKILADARFSAQERIDILGELRCAQYEEDYVTVPYRFSETLPLCEAVIAEDDAGARAGAQTVLNWLNGDRDLLIPTQHNPKVEAEELLRAAGAAPDDSQSETLLVAAEAPEVEPEH